MGDDCGDAVKQLYEFLDGELTEERRELIRRHLDDCPPCYEAFDFEGDLRKTIANRCKDEVPASLRERVADAIRDQGTQPLL